jgi:programmed cell death 6-interacting protein
MSNLLVIPFKKTNRVPIKQAVQEYLQVRTAFHPEAFRWDISHWIELRREGVSEDVHVESVKRMLRSVQPRSGRGRLSE